MTNRLIAYGASAAALAAIIALAAQFTNALPVPAWASDIVLVQSEVRNLDRRVTNEALDQITLRVYQNLREQRAYTDKAQPPPNYLLQEQTTLESKRRQLEARLRSLQ